MLSSLKPTVSHPVAASARQIPPLDQCKDHRTAIVQRTLPKHRSGYVIPLYFSHRYLHYDLCQYIRWIAIIAGPPYMNVIKRRHIAMKAVY